MVNYHAERRPTGHIEALGEPIPLRDVRLTVRGTATRAFTVFGGDELDVHLDNGAVTVVVPRVDVHELVVFEP